MKNCIQITDTSSFADKDDEQIGITLADYEAPLLRRGAQYAMTHVFSQIEQLKRDMAQCKNETGRDNIYLEMLDRQGEIEALRKLRDFATGVDERAQIRSSYGE